MFLLCFTSSLLFPPGAGAVARAGPVGGVGVGGVVMVAMVAMVVMVIVMVVIMVIVMVVVLLGLLVIIPSTLLSLALLALPSDEREKISLIFSFVYWSYELYLLHFFPPFLSSMTCRTLS